MPDTNVVVAIIGGLFSLAVGGLSGVLIYRRAIKVDLTKVQVEGDLGLLDRWKSYSSELKEQVEMQRARIADQEARLLARGQEIDELKKLVLEQSLKLTEQAHEIKILRDRIDHLEGVKSA